MSNLYSKIAQIKRNSEPANMSYSQTQWINGKKLRFLQLQRTFHDHENNNFNKQLSLSP